MSYRTSRSTLHVGRDIFRFLDDIEFEHFKYKVGEYITIHWSPDGKEKKVSGVFGKIIEILIARKYNTSTKDLIPVYRIWVDEEGLIELMFEYEIKKLTKRQRVELAIKRLNGEFNPTDIY